MSKNGRMTIREFLEARIAEDEELARAASVGMHGKHEDAWDWGGYVLGADRDSTPKQDEFITAWWPARILAECAAKRAIIAAHAHHVDMGGKEYGPGFRFVSDGMVQGLMVAIEDLAAVYKDHPDYQQEWGV